jgi:hypothetical protein
MWTNKNAYNEAAGQTGPEDLKETKMPTFWRTPFTKICLGMRSQSGNINWMTINKTADSLFSLLADGTEKTTTLGKPAWVTLFPDHVLQTNPCKTRLSVRYILVCLRTTKECKKYHFTIDFFSTLFINQDLYHSKIVKRSLPVSLKTAIKTDKLLLHAI